MTDSRSNSNQTDLQRVFEWQQAQHQQQQQQQDQADFSTKRGKKRSAAAVNSSNNADKDDSEGGGQAMVFPVKLHRMLTQIDDKAKESKDSTTGYSGDNTTDNDAASIVSWQPHGRCFLVHDKDAFVQRFLPSYFRQSKWASFQRQLNIYGFQRLTAGRDRGAYYHDLFLRGHPELATRIHRMKLKGIGQGRHRTNAELEPNFYRMKPVGAGDRLDISSLGMQSRAVTSALTGTGAPAPSPQAPTTAANTINVLQLFGGAANPAATQNQASGSNLVGSGTDLNNLYFLGNSNDLSSLQNLGGIAASGTGASNDSSTGAQQEGLQSAQHLSLLANLFNAANNNNSNNNNAGGNTNPSHAQDNNSVDDTNQWSASNLFGTGNNSLGPLFQNADANLFSTATLMQYMSDNNTPERGHSPPDATGVSASSGAAQSSAPSPWSTLAAAGLTGSTHQPLSFALHQNDTSNTNASTSQGNYLANSNSSGDLANTFNLDGPSLRRMSAAAVSTLLSATGGGSNNTNAASNSNNTFDSNPNIYLFNTLHQSRNSNGNLMEASSSDNTATMTATQALNRLAANSNSGLYAAAPGPSPTPASQQLALLTGAGGGTGQGSSGSGYLFSDLLSQRAAGGTSQTTFLDSVYEPIPIKENAHGNREATSDATNSGQQHKLSPVATGASAGPTQGGGSRGFYLPSDYQR